ncbi:OmpA family protein [Sphingomonas sp. STIS6.2]|uniref:OmpA family protein n=1 Tax=Sphingomonas sp. STIS6.2 TaxID=1379700 RepID=UPI001F1A3D6B|nr:OmpA family protein [Sphingomonas sp. STIS6.2]
MANNNRKGEGAPPSHIHVGKTEKKTNWLAWLALALGLLALLFALSRCGRDEPVAQVAPAAVPVAEPVAPPAPTVVAVPAGTSTVGAYLAGSEPLPRTFVFEKLNFDTAGNIVRTEDQAEVAALIATLKQHPTSRMRVVGYADARGASDANTALGKSRADSVKASLVAGGIEADRIETASGGETNPVDSNATAAGQAENRRTELVVLQR